MKSLRNKLTDRTKELLDRMGIINIYDLAEMFWKGREDPENWWQSIPDKDKRKIMKAILDPQYYPDYPGFLDAVKKYTFESEGSAAWGMEKSRIFYSMDVLTGKIRFKEWDAQGHITCEYNIHISAINNYKELLHLMTLHYSSYKDEDASTIQAFDAGHQKFTIEYLSGRSCVIEDSIILAINGFPISQLLQKQDEIAIDELSRRSSSLNEVLSGRV